MLSSRKRCLSAKKRMRWRRKRDMRESDTQLRGRKSQAAVAQVAVPAAHPSSCLFFGRCIQAADDVDGADESVVEQQAQIIAQLQVGHTARISLRVAWRGRKWG